MTTHNWGELAHGIWLLEIDNEGWDGIYLIRFKIFVIMYNT